MINHTSQDDVHIAVWEFAIAMHEGELGKLLDDPIFSWFGGDRLTPVFSEQYIEEASIAPLLVIPDTLELLELEGILRKRGVDFDSVYTEEGVPIHLDMPELRGIDTVWSPTLLPQSAEITDAWPEYTDRKASELYTLMRAIVSSEEANEHSREIRRAGLDRDGYDDIIRSVERDPASLRKIVARKTKSNQ